MLHGGRWNSPGKRVIYAAETYAGALLEVLVHANLGMVPQNHGIVSISIPDGIRIDIFERAKLIGWADENLIISRQFGDRWLQERRSAVLVVPSIVLQGRERNILINPDHPDFTHIVASDPEPVTWDARLFPMARQDSSTP
jgi:RES domain-containing protein